MLRALIAAAALARGARAQYFASVSTFAGSGAIASIDGVGTSAAFFGPLAVANANGTLFVGDRALIRAISPGGYVSTYASAADSTTYYTGIAFGNGVMYAVGYGQYSFACSVSAYRQPVGTTVFAGQPVRGCGCRDGFGTNAQFSDLTSITVAMDGIVYVADSNCKMVRAITPAGNVSTLAVGLRFMGVTASSDGLIYSTAENRVYSITKAGIIKVIAGGGIN
jgi:hypothetical protein